MPEGLGYGIGLGLEKIGEGLTRRFQNQADAREKQADALHEKGLHIASNLQQYAMDTPDPTAIQFAGKSYKPEAGPLIEQLKATSEQVRGLFGPHETPALVQHFRKFLGKGPKAPTPNPRAAQYSPEGFAAEVPVQPDKTLETLNSIRRQVDAANKDAPPERRAQMFTEAVNSRLGIGAASDEVSPHGTPQEGKDEAGNPAMLQEFVDKSGKITTKPVPGVSPPPPAVPMELKWDTSPVSGGPMGVFDPNTGKHYDANTVANASPEIQGEWKSREDYAKRINDQKEAAELKKIKDQEARDDKRYAHQATLQANAFENAFKQKDYAAAEAIKKTAEDKYNAALALSNFADGALAHPEAATDKLLAGQLIRVSEGRFNPAQYDNLVKSAGLGNTFQQWMETASTGQLTDTIRKQLVDTAHLLLSSADGVRKSLTPPATPGDLKEKAKSGGATSPDSFKLPNGTVVHKQPDGTYR